MSGSFNEREQAFENKFKHDEELRFKIQAKAIKLFGLWAASELGLKGADADSYALKVLDADFEGHGLEGVMKKVKKDFAAKGKEVTEHHLQNEYNVHLAAAKKAHMAA
jgi:hypothetical protein